MNAKYHYTTHGKVKFMRKTIKEKLDKIDECFTSDRLTKSKERWRRLWAGEPPQDRIPYDTVPISAPQYDPIIDKKSMLDIMLDDCIWRGHIESDHIPSLFSGCRQGTIPSMFGAREIVAGAHEDDYTCERLLNSYEDVDNLCQPELHEYIGAWRWIELAKFYLEETEGRIAIQVCDMQGPVDTAGQLMGYENLLLLANDEPELYRSLIKKTTLAYEMLWQAQKDIIGEELFAGTHLIMSNWYPKCAGVTVSVDSMVMVSPSFFEEFYAPSLEEIAEKFGGVTIHSCGNFSNVTKSIGRVKGMRGIHASEMSIKELIDAGIDKNLMFISMSGMEQIEESMSYNKQNSIRSVMNINPWIQGKKAGKPWLWDNNEWSQIKRNEQIILSSCAI